MPVFFKIIALLFGGIALWSAQEQADIAVSLFSLTPPDLHFEKYTDVSPFISDDMFQSARIITDKAKLANAEDLAVDSQGNIYSGLLDGRIVRIDLSGSIQELAQLKGELLFGIVINQDQTALFFVAETSGVCKLDLQTNKIEKLFDSFQGKHLISLNNIALDQKQQKMYVTHSTHLVQMKYAVKEVMLKMPRGRVLEYDFETKQIREITTGLCFPNGIVYDAQTHSLIVAQLNQYRIIRISLSDLSISVVISNLPGTPDNIKLNERRQLLVAIPAFRDAVTDLLDSHGAVRRFIMLLPEPILYMVANRAASGGIKINLQTGKIVDFLLGKSKQIDFVTTVLEKEGKIYMSSLKNPTIAVIDLKKWKPSRQDSSENDEL